MRDVTVHTALINVRTTNVLVMPILMRSVEPRVGWGTTRPPLFSAEAKWCRSLEMARAFFTLSALGFSNVARPSQLLSTSGVSLPHGLLPMRRFVSPTHQSQCGSGGIPALPPRPTLLEWHAAAGVVASKWLLALT